MAFPKFNLNLTSKEQAPRMLYLILFLIFMCYKLKGFIRSKRTTEFSCKISLREERGAGEGVDFGPGTLILPTSR